MDRKDVRWTVSWSLVTATAIAVFWAAWWLIAGNVPAIQMLQLTESRVVTLPLRISRWWDILAGLVWLSLFTATLLRAQNRDRADILIINTTLGGLMSIYPAFSIGLGDPLRTAGIAMLVTMATYGTLIAIFARKTRGATPFSCIGVGFGFAIGATIGGGIALGTAAGLAAGMVSGASAVLVFTAILVATALPRATVRVVAPSEWWHQVVRRLARKELAALRAELERREHRIRELETVNRTQELQRRDLEGRMRQLEQQGDQLQNLVVWCALREGITVEELRARCLWAQQQERLIAAWRHPLAEVKLGNRLRKVLAARNIQCLGDLAAMTPEQLSDIRGIGRMSRANIHRLLIEHGLDFGMRRPEGLPSRPSAPGAPSP